MSDLNQLTGLSREAVYGEVLEVLRRELTGYSYRMLGSFSDAEDAVQETMFRAWRSRHQYDSNVASLRTWVYKIATNVCLDMLRARGRRARAMDLGPASQPGDPLGAPHPRTTWIEPIPDDAFLPADGDPAELLVLRDSIRLALVAALQNLPPRQRAVLILRDVLSWQAAEVAALLETSTASVNSALQRARARMTASETNDAEPLQPLDPDQRALLTRYVEAFEHHDVDGLISLLAEDASMSMPPFAWWLSGRDHIRVAWLAGDTNCDRSRLVPAGANGSPAFGHYVYSEQNRTFVPRALQHVELAGDLIVGLTSFLDTGRLFPQFALPTTLDR